MSTSLNCAVALSATLALVSSAAAMIAAPVSVADQPTWTGKYRLVGYASDKLGTSVAARQKEPAFAADSVVTSSCGSGRCIATVSGPAPSNPTIPQPTRYAWDGTRWANTFDWQWECFVGDGQPVQFSAARSWTFYAPQSDGSLQGKWHTDILTGPCRGNVIMPVAAIPIA